MPRILSYLKGLSVNTKVNDGQDNRPTVRLSQSAPNLAENFSKDTPAPPPPIYKTGRHIPPSLGAYRNDVRRNAMDVSRNPVENQASGQKASIPGSHQTENELPRAPNLPRTAIATSSTAGPFLSSPGNVLLRRQRSENFVGRPIFRGPSTPVIGPTDYEKMLIKDIPRATEKELYVLLLKKNNHPAVKAAATNELMNREISYLGKSGQNSTLKHLESHGGEYFDKDPSNTSKDKIVSYSNAFHVDLEEDPRLATLVQKRGNVSLSISVKGFSSFSYGRFDPDSSTESLDQINDENELTNSVKEQIAEAEHEHSIYHHLGEGKYFAKSHGIVHFEKNGNIKSALFHERIQGKDGDDHLEDLDDLPAAEVRDKSKKLVFGWIAALDAVHARNVVHGEVRSHNFFSDDSGNTKILNFEKSRICRAEDDFSAKVRKDYDDLADVLDGNGGADYSVQDLLEKFPDDSESRRDVAALKSFIEKLRNGDVTPGELKNDEYFRSLNLGEAE
jgi:hypothetical protein